MTEPTHFQGSGAVRDAHRFNETALTAWMQAHVSGFQGPLQVEQFRGGQSNPTYKLSAPSGTYVLRRKPPGTLLPGAHAVDREARVLRSLHARDFPVPRVHGLCTDDTVIGTWFYVMDFVAGRIFWDATLPAIAAPERPAYFEAMNQTIARLHQFDYKELDLADYGRPGNYFQRQIARWSGQYEADELAGRDANMDRVTAWLRQSIPSADETSLIHGDMRIDNLIFHPTEPRVIAVLDWELSTLGHPLADFAYHMMMYRMRPLVITGLLGSNLPQLNIPSESQYVQSYCRKTGRSDIPDLDFYVAFNMFRLAAIYHGIKGRLLRGTAASEHARSMADAFPTIAQYAWDQAVRANQAGN